MTTKILLVDDHQLTRRGIRRSLDRQAGIEVIGEAGSGAEAIQFTARHKTDVVVMDIGMPEMDGVEATKRILASDPDVKVIVLSMHDSDKMISRAFNAGARAYLLKDCKPDELVEAVKAVVAGRKYLSSTVTHIVVDDFVCAEPNSESRSSVSSPCLTEQQRKVVQLITKGNTSKDIGQTLRLSVKTVEKHKRAVMKKLHARNIAELVTTAVQEHLLTE